MPTLPGSQIPPPKSWDELEILLWRLFQEVWNDPYAQRHGRLGQRQHGIDIFGRPNQGESWEGVQVKGKNGAFGQNVTEHELKGEVLKAKEFLPHIQNFFLVTSAQRDASIQEVARQLTEEHLSQGLFSVHVWGWEDVEERLPQFPKIVSEHYPQFLLTSQEETYSTGSAIAGDFISRPGMERIEELIQDLLQVHGVGGLGLEPQRLPFLDYPPLNPSIYAPRIELIEQVQVSLQDGHWVALVGSTGTGKTFLAKSIWEIQSPDLRYWISFRGQDGQYVEHLDGQLIHWVTVASHDESLFDLYRQGRIGWPDIAQHLGSIVNQSSFLVLDDLPDLTLDQRLLDRLAGLAVAWWNSGGIILSTSQYHPAARFQDILGTELTEFVVPAMDGRELGRFLESAGAPLSFNTPKFVSMLLGLTKGHPVLIAATTQWLSRNHWNVNQVFLSLITGEATTQVMGEARIQVRRLVGSDQARDLLDRLSMVTSSFNHDMVWALAMLEPSIDRPIERFNELVGPWVQELENSKYQVSPLLQTASQEYIPPDLRKNIHSAIAREWLGERTLGVNDALQVCVHLAGAEEWFGLAAVIFRVMNAMETPRHAEMSEWATWFFRPASKWPDEVPSPLRIIVRASQVKLLMLLGKSAADYESDLEHLITGSVTSQEALAVLFARMQTGPMLEQAPPDIAASRAIQAARIVREGNLPIPPETLPPDPEILLWSANTKIKDQPQIRRVLDVVLGLTLEERKVVFSLDVGAQMAAMFTEMCYSVEAAKPSDAQDWDGVLATLDDIDSVGNLEGASILRWAAIRTRAMVLADFLDDAQKANSLLEEGLSEAGGVFQYLLKFTQASIFAARGENDKAFDSFIEALDIPAESVFPFYYYDGLRRGMIVASSSGNWDAAKAWCLRLLREGTPESTVGWHDWTELLGELGWIHWNTGLRKKACGAMFGVVLRLLSSVEINDPRYWETLLKVGHVTGWYAGIAQSGKPPNVTIDGQKYIDPYPGMLCLRAQKVAEVDRASRLHYLPSQIAMMASGVGLPRIAVVGYRLASEHGRTQGHKVFGAVMDGQRAPIEAELGNYERAIEAGISGGKSILMTQKLAADALDSLEDPEVEWEQAGLDKKASIQSFHLYYMVLLPAFVKLVADGVDRAVGRFSVERIMSSMDSLRKSLVQEDRWKQITKYMSFAFDTSKSRQDILDELRVLDADEHHQRMILYVALAQHPQRRPDDLFHTQSLLLTHLTVPQMVEVLTVRNVCRWINRSWRDEVSTRGFRLNSPNLLRSELNTISESSDNVADAARILLSAQIPAGTNPDQDLLNNLHLLASHSEA